MNEQSGIIQKLVSQIELYEWIGLGASFVWISIYFLLGPSVDAQEGVPGWHYKPFAWIFAIYEHSVPQMVAAVGGLLLAAGFVKYRRPAVAIRFACRSFATFVRFIFPLCVLLIVYRLVNFYIPVLRPVDRDAWLLAADRFLFSIQPSIGLEPLIRPWLTDLMSFFYSAWFFLIFATLLLLQFHSKRAIRGYLTSVILSFYLGYLGYLLIPAVGPVYSLQQQYTASLHGGLMTSLQESLVHQDLSVPRDCFPSLHTAISCVMLFYMMKYRRSWLWLYVPLSAGIILSTIYLRWHYAVDVLAGMVLAALTCWCGLRWTKLWAARRRPSVHISTAGILEKSTKL